MEKLLCGREGSGCGVGCVEGVGGILWVEGAHAHHHVPSRVLSVVAVLYAEGLWFEGKGRGELGNEGGFWGRTRRSRHGSRHADVVWNLAGAPGVEVSRWSERDWTGLDDGVK